MKKRFTEEEIIAFLRVFCSGFYAWQQRPPSASEMANRPMSQAIRTIHHELNGIYGHRRIKAELSAVEHACCRRPGRID